MELTNGIFNVIISPIDIGRGIIIIVKTKIFELYARKYKNLSELAQAMGISVSQIYRVREGKRNINQKFLIGAISAFPGHKLDDLFYLTPEMPTVTNSHQPSASRQAVKEEQSMRPALKRLISTVEAHNHYFA